MAVMSDRLQRIAFPMDELNLSFRTASREDLEPIVQLLADDPLGRWRETGTLPLLDSYVRAFEEIDRDPNNELVLAEHDGRVVGVLQLTFIPCITYRGGRRALVEGVRVSTELRSSGIGKRMLLWAIARARERHCHLVQLTSDKARSDAVRFYESLGFVPSHEGMKLHLSGAPGESE
jgi:GNAT superfamily N-acetyltransferase